MCSMRYSLEATQLEDVEDPQLPAPRFAVLHRSTRSTNRRPDLLLSTTIVENLSPI